MKTIFKKFPIASKFIIAILLFGLAIILSGLLQRGLIKQYFPYAPCILLFVTTWHLLKMDQQSLKSIGLNFSIKNISFLPLGVLIGALAFGGAKFLRAQYTGESFELNTSINYSLILPTFYFILPQVAVEELLFRGYLFKKTIKISNVVKANIVFSILFMLVHVLDENVLKNLGMILFLTITIPVGHLLFATALLKSKTLFFPIGIHLGNNWATIHLISGNYSEESIFYIADTTVFESWPPFIITIIITNLFFLFVTFLIWKWNIFQELFFFENN